MRLGGKVSHLGSPVSPRQLALALDHAESLAREDFLSGPPNAAALSLIDRWPDWPARVVALIGPEGSGKSHLAAIWAEAAGARVLAAKLLAAIDPPSALATGALVIEDLEPEGLDEPALFHLLNLAREEGAYVLLTARTAPTGFPVAIRDLGSRLRALPAVTLAGPDDA
ncbi:MAG: chromosomal replication initiator DnaA, partial [Candidatus Binataceae bacterium]